MSGTSATLAAAIETYLADLSQVRASGGATDERSYYPALARLLNAVGATLKPSVYSVVELADRGAGHPDIGLFATIPAQSGASLEGQLPERGVVEVKSPKDDTWLTAESDQVSRYWRRYRQVLVTNMREFVLVGADQSGRPARLEAFRLAASEEEFARLLAAPREFGRGAGTGLGEYLRRTLAHRATLADPKDLAWLLASYARDGLARVEAVGDAHSLKTVREALEAALGVRFEGARGARFFRSTLVQTLFYGIFSAWVLWARKEMSQASGPLFDGDYRPRQFSWRESGWHLRVPVLRALFQQVSDPGRLAPLGLVEVLDWAAAALDRVDRPAFFARFRGGEAVPYFYEPFLEAFDPELRKELGVWYTPVEVVRYIVARVDRALKDDLGVAEGLAADHVYVLDPCCGTGAFLAEVLRRIAANAKAGNGDALAGQRLKRAAAERVFGFEIMPAPFVVAQLQVGLALEELGAPLADGGGERAGIFLTNALSGWESRATQALPFPELEEERDRAERVKQETPILVVLGNPPYNGFAGMAVDEERDLSEAYRQVRRVRRPEGQGLNDLYVRFYRMAERRIAERTGSGVVCFITNHSWLDGLSFTGMRERYLEAFDAVRIDCLNGDKYRTGKTAPDGTPDPSIFSTESDPVGIQVGTAIATLVRKAEPAGTKTVEIRQLWGRGKRRELAATAEQAPDALYESFAPQLKLGLPFLKAEVADGWFDWPTIPEVFPVSFPGVKTSRDGFLVDIELDRLKVRVGDYFDPSLGHEEVARRYPAVMQSTARFDAVAVREAQLARGGPDAAAFVKFAYRPFDNRWLYWATETELLDRERSDYAPHVCEGNAWLVTQRKPRREWSPPQFIRDLGCLDLMDRGAACIPLRVRYMGNGPDGNGERSCPNLSAAAQRYVDRLGADPEDLFYYALAALHDPSYRAANSGALRMEWPRIPLPSWPNGGSGAAEELAGTAGRGRLIARVLDADAQVPGVTEPPLRSEFKAIAIPDSIDGSYWSGDDFAVTAGWGRNGSGEAVMPGRGQLRERDFSAGERAALGASVQALGGSTFDVYLNSRVFWRNLPAAVWRYKLGGYPVLKKWLSYRERDIVGRPLNETEVRHFSGTARRISALLRNGGGFQGDRG